MDDRNRSKSKVVPLRRKGRSENGDRGHVASKIFAEEDGIGTFSLGNLVPPKHHAPADDARGLRPDGEREPDSAFPERAAAVEQERDEFFEELIARTSVGTATDGASPQAPTLPGSAYLPSELPAKDGGRGSSLRRLVGGLAIRRGGAGRSTLTGKTGRTSHMARAAVLGAVVIAVLAGLAGAVLLGHGGHARPSAGLPQASQYAPSIEPRPASAAAWAALREHRKAAGGRKHHPTRPRHRKTARPHKSSSPPASTASCCTAQTTQPQPPQSAQSPSTTGGSGGARHRAKAGPTGRVSLIGAGTSPSG
jgi:hypothetical protein